MLQAVADASHGVRPDKSILEALVRGEAPEALAAKDDASLALYKELAGIDRMLQQDHEIPSILHALDGKFVRPAPGGDLLRTPAILPTGRNLHGFDPFRIPSAFAVQDGAQQAQRLIDKHVGEGHGIPESVAIVLWGTDNLKNEGAPIGQALALLGAKPRFDGYGRLTGAELLPLDQLNRPRIDVIVTMSGIFRDLLPLQIKLLAEACFLAASADEPVERNFVRKHALAFQAANNCDLETASLACVRQCRRRLWLERQPSGRERPLGRRGRTCGDLYAPQELCLRHQGTAGAADGAAEERARHRRSRLPEPRFGRTRRHHRRSLFRYARRHQPRRAHGQGRPVGAGLYRRSDPRRRHGPHACRSRLSLETRTRMLNPKWYEGMLKHGYEGVRQIEEHVTNTMGWSATTGEVAPWVYRQLTETFMLDPAMRERLASLNPVASAKVANRLIEAHERKYWSPDPEMLDVLRRAGEELEDRLEGVGVAA